MKYKCYIRLRSGERLEFLMDSANKAALAATLSKYGADRFLQIGEVYINYEQIDVVRFAPIDEDKETH